MLHLVPIYRALAVGQLQAVAQYRVQIFLWMLFTIIRPVIFLAAWVAVTAARGGSVGAFSASDFAAYYVALTLVLHFTGFWHAWEFDYEVRMGRLSPKLLRPLHPIHYAVVESAVSKLYALLGLAPALVLIAWTFGARFTTDVLDVVLFVPSLVLAAALRFVSGWAIACLAFWTTRSGGAYHLSDRATFIFGGQIAPLSLMPGILEPLAYALPFGYMLAVPTEILRGGLGLEAALLLIGGQVVWLAVSWVMLQAAWRAGVRQYTAVGAL